MLHKLIKNIALIITFIIVACYIAALVAPYIPPNRFIWTAYFGMVIPLWLFLLCCTAIFWLWRQKWIISIMLILLISLSFSSWRNTVVLNESTNTESVDTLRLMTYNIHMFDYYKKFDEIIEVIKQSDADIVCLQEFGYYTKYKISKDKLFSIIDEMYPYRHIWYKNQSSRSHNGLITLSKYPIINKKKIEYQTKHNISIYTDIKIGDDTIRVINNHLESNKLSSKDREIASLLTEDFDSDTFLSRSKSVQDKLGYALQYRAQQAQVIRKTINESPYKTIVMGDFNDVPQSYVYHKIKGDMKSCYVESGNWLYYWTYNQKGFYFAIDHILVDKSFTPLNTEIIKVKHSDHYPVVSTIAR